MWTFPKDTAFRVRVALAIDEHYTAIATFWYTYDYVGTELFLVYLNGEEEAALLLAQW